SRPASGVLPFARSARAAGVYPAALHDALPISGRFRSVQLIELPGAGKERHRRLCEDLMGAEGKESSLDDRTPSRWHAQRYARPRSEEDTSELQARENLVCRLLREKKKCRRKRG